MSAHNRLGAAALALLVLTACDSGTATATGPGAVSEGEARALDDAAEMLKERRLPEGALPPVETPEQAAPIEQTESE